MASLRDIRKRIRSVKNTQQITKAMKMVSAAKLRKAQDAILAARPYAQALDAMMSELAGSSAEGGVTHPLLAPHAVTGRKKVELLVLTSDRGLAGGFNSNVVRRVTRFLYETRDADVRVSTVGRKGHDAIRRRPDVPVRRDYPGLFAKISYTTAQQISEELSSAYLAGEVDEVHLVYNEFVSAISQKVSLVQLLPFAGPQEQTRGAAPAAGGTEFEYEPGPQGVLDRLVPQALATKIYRALLESVASEHGARMSAMENATSNASDMIGKLTLYYNRTRQAVITKELMEIVSGAEALK